VPTSCRFINGIVEFLAMPTEAIQCVDLKRAASCFTIAEHLKIVGDGARA